MRRQMMVVLVVLTSAFTSSAREGIFRVEEAEIREKDDIYIGICTGAFGSIYQNKNVTIIPLYGSIFYVIRSGLELGISPVGAVYNNFSKGGMITNTDEDMLSIDGLIKFLYGGFDNLTMGITGFLSFPYHIIWDYAKETYERKHMPEYLKSEGIKYGVKAMVSFDISPLKFHINEGYTINNDKLIDGKKDKDILFSGVSIELPGGDFSFIFEVTDERKIGGRKDGATRITPGIAMKLENILTLSLGLNYRVNERGPYYIRSFHHPIEPPKWEFMAGLTFKPVTPRKVTSEKAVISGVVRDKESGMPIFASVSLPKKRLSITTDADGKFVLKNIEEGIVEVLVSADGYMLQTVALTLKPKQRAEVEFLLELERGVASLVGKVLDMETGEPLIAKIEFPELSRVIQTDSAGIYIIKEISTGSHTVLVSCNGYLGRKTMVKIEKYGMNAADFYLFKVGTRIVFDVNFKDEAIASESQSEIEKIANLLLKNPDIVVEVQSYTDNIGSADYNLDLSQKRASALVQYLITRYNINGERLVARGYGEGIPIDSSETREGREKNNRIELLILGKME